MIKTTSIKLLKQNFIKFQQALVATQNKRFLQHAANKQNHINDKHLIYTENEGYYRTSPYPKVNLPTTTLDEYIWTNIKNWQNEIATVCVVTGREYTYAKLRDSCAALAVRLQKTFKLNNGDVVAVCLPNVPEYPIVTLGALEAGLVVTTMNPIYMADEIARQLCDSNAKIIFCLTQNYETIKKACEIAKKNLPVICIKAFNPTENLPPKTIDFFDIINPNGINFSDLKRNTTTKDDLCFLPYSSGTTGLPKGVMLTHANITSNCEMVQNKLPDTILTEPTTDDYQEVIPCFLPFFHIYGLSITMLSKLYLGCKIVTIPKFTPEDLLKSLTVYKGTALNLVPPVLMFLTQHPMVEAKNFPHLKGVMSGAAPVGQLDVEKFLKKFPNVVFAQGYGLTETSPVVFLTPNNFKKYATTGFVIANTQIKIVSMDGNSTIGLGTNESGEICVKGPQVMKGYLNNEEATKNTFTSDGYLRTGDVGHYDEEGYYTITDRMKELIKVKGFQVPPAELEELLRDHPKILDAAVFGIISEKHGEVPKAAVVLKQGAKATEKEIQDFIAEKVANYKQLTGGVEFLKEIPKNASGKIMRRSLKEKFSK